jgi:nucleotide-binding universal stress UspA family protein
LLGCRIATTLPTSALAAAADEAIDNRDRNLGNILWDGRSEAWIDHAYALGQRAMADVNKLCAMAQTAGTADALRTGAVGQALALDRRAIAAAAMAMPASMGAQQLAALVSARIGSVAASLLSRFPAPDDLLSPAP